MSAKSYLDTVKGRRSVYALEKKSPISDARLEEIVKDTVLHTPSAFNSQTTRVVVLLKDDHDKFWEFVKAAIKAIVPAEQFASSETRLNGFKAGYGTALFFEDQMKIKGFQEKVALYADRFPEWSEHTSGMHQLVLWTALEAEGLGASLQHYNPLIDQQVQATWNVPATWVLKAQLVFGSPTGAAKEKAFEPVEERVFFHGN